jgi:hypothetical protein
MRPQGFVSGHRAAGAVTGRRRGLKSTQERAAGQRFFGLPPFLFSEDSEEYQDLRRFWTPVHLYIAWMLSGVGEADEAFDWIEKAFEEKKMYLQFWRLPVFDSLTSNPRFYELRRRFNPGV